jgi:hypothetical protein
MRRGGDEGVAVPETGSTARSYVSMNLIHM